MAELTDGPMACWICSRESELLLLAPAARADGRLPASSPARPSPGQRSRASTRARARPPLANGYRPAWRDLLVHVACVEARTFDANNNPATRGCRLPSTSSQLVLHIVPVLKWGCPARATVRVRVEDRTGV